ncbi:uncharacterized protein FN964_004453 isoform 2-T2 [Alca torda]
MHAGNCSSMKGKAAFRRPQTAYLEDRQCNQKQGYLGMEPLPSFSGAFQENGKTGSAGEKASSSSSSQQQHYVARSVSVSRLPPSSPQICCSH